MSDRVHLTTWLDRASKARFGSIAKANGLSESALLRQLVESTLTDSGIGRHLIPRQIPVSGNPVDGMVPLLNDLDINAERH
jgi:hypothetical protein